METKDGTAPPDAGARGKRLELSAELLSILLVGAALAALILTGVGEIREDMRERFSSMEGRMSLMEGRMSSMEGRLAVVEREQGEIRGLLEGMRDTAAGRPGPGEVETSGWRGGETFRRSAGPSKDRLTAGSRGDSGDPGGGRRGSADDSGPGGHPPPVVAPAGRGAPDAPVTLRAAADAPPP